MEFFATVPRMREKTRSDADRSALIHPLNFPTNPRNLDEETLPVYRFTKRDISEPPRYSPFLCLEGTKS